MSKILLSGYYGYNNAGDEAILKSIIYNIKAIDSAAEITVLSDDIEFTQKKYDINAAKRFNPFSIAKALLDCDILISGGGTLFQDKTSTRSLIYYTSIINAAKFLGKVVMIYANGIGPLQKPKNRKRVKTSIENADIVTLRDQEALDTVKSLGVKNDRIYLTTDPVFSLREDEESAAEQILLNSGIDVNGRFLVVSVRDWENKKDFVNNFALACDYVVEKYGKKILFLPLQFPNDLEVIYDIQDQMSQKSTIIKDITPMQMMSVIKKADYVIAMRLHALIFAAKVGTPMIAYSYDVKVDNFMNQIDIPYKCDVNTAEISEMKKHIDDVEKNLSGIRDALKINTEKIKKQSEKNLDYMKKAFEMLN